MSSIEVREDTEDRFRWDTITSVFDGDGNLIERFTENDDGTTREQLFENGIVFREVLTDDAVTSAKPWQSIERSYDPSGNLLDSFELRDDGVTIQKDYQDGQLWTITETDINDDGSQSDARSWQSRFREFDDNGDMQFSFEVRDDGVTIEKDFQFGQLWTVTETDLNDDGSQSDARIWESRFTEYNDNGDLLFSFEVRDDGVTIEKDYQFGQLWTVTETDLNDDGSQSDARIWQSRFTEYDDNGDLQFSFEVRDDGVTIQKDYQFGQLWTVTETDLNDDGSQSDARIWQFRFTEYDDNGNLQLTLEQRDDGVTIEKTYQDGVLSSVFETDLNEDGSQSDARNWENRFTQYDENGQKLESFELRDNGVTIATQYENGVISARIMEDRDEFGAMTDAEAWDTFIFIYDENGKLASRRVDFDDGDVTVDLFEDGQNAVRLQVDGDDDKPWYLRETLYAEDGSVAEINTYAAPEDVPSQYDFLSDEMVFVA
ncbi:MAG: hypothetical protein AAF641_11330 [Pseudomonadota bacterium]